MVQVFGNRIIGGVGAPDPRMSEAFGTGVTTALGQRDARQVMNIRAQDQQFKIEDREEAKRRRAAADAAAAAARTRTAAMNKRYAELLGTPGAAPAVAGLTLPAAAPGTARDRQGPAAAPAGVRPPVTTAAPVAGGQPVYTPLSFGGGNTIAGGAGSTSVGGGTGTDTLGVPQTVAPAPTPAPPGASEFVVTPSTEGMLPDYVEAPGLWSAIAGAPAGAANADTLLKEGWINGYEYQQLVRGSRGQQQDVLANVGRRKAGADVPFFTPGVATATTAAPTATTATPTEPAATAATAGVPPEVSVTLPDGQQLVLSTGTVAPTQPTQLTFGPKLGSPDRTQEDVFVDELMMRTGADQRPPAPPVMGEPGAPNRAVTRLMSERDRQVQLAQAALEFNDMQTYQAAASKIMELDVALEAGVARMAISELRYSNAPQRLNAIMTEITGMQHEYVPTAAGVYDKYVNGELYQQGMDMNAVAEETLMQADANYAQQQAALDQMRLEAGAKGMGQAEANIYEYGEKAAIDANKALTVGLTEIDLLAMKRDLGFGDQDQIDFQKDENTGIIVVFRNGEPTAQYKPIAEVDATGNEITRYEQVY
jgi:hypothetical protein